MALLEIRKYGDPVLREKARPIAHINGTHRQMAEDMGETMYEAHGIGLAANQVGSLERILVIDVSYAEQEERPKGGKRGEPVEKELEVYINPEILETSDEDTSYNEGCLSIPGIEGDVYRPVSIRLRWQNLEGETHEETVDGMRARVLQHEIDHLDGVLFVDHLGKARRLRLAGKLNRLKQETLELLREKEHEAQVGE